MINENVDTEGQQPLLPQKPLLMVAVYLGASGVLSGVLAQPAQRGRQAAPMYDMKTEAGFTGTVDTVENVTRPDLSGRRSLGGTHLILKTAAERLEVPENLQRIANQGVVDFTLREEDYFDPWRATRVVAVWFELMLQEANGDLDLAIRSYHRGWPVARRGEGETYLANVKRLRRRYIRDEESSPAWHFLFNRARSETMASAPRWQGRAILSAFRRETTDHYASEE